MLFVVYGLFVALLSECVGRPQDKGMLHWFQMLCQWLESEADAELYLYSSRIACQDGGIRLWI